MCLIRQNLCSFQEDNWKHSVHEFRNLETIKGIAVSSFPLKKDGMIICNECTFLFRCYTSALTINVLVPPPHQQCSQKKQQQADTDAAHDEACVVLLLRQRHLAQMPDGVRLAPLEQWEGIWCVRSEGSKCEKNMTNIIIFFSKRTQVCTMF